MANTLKLILLGPPGSGKGTQAERLEEVLKLEHVSTGDMLRNAVEKGNSLGREVGEFLNAGKLVSDALVARIVDQRLNELGDRGFVLDGYPRTIEQALSLDRWCSGSKVTFDAVVLFDVAEQTVLGRITGRRIDPDTGRVYQRCEPLPEEIRTRLRQRDDDREDVVKKRLEIYHRLTKPVVDHYEELGVLIRIDGASDPDQVFESLLELEPIKRQV
jgi:adenylate kinase